MNYYLGRIDSAQFYFDRAEAVYTAIENAPDAEEEVKRSVPKLHAQLLNNQAAIDVAQKNYDSAYERLKKALSIVPETAEDDQLLLYRSMSAVCKLANHAEEEKHYAQLAKELAAKLGL